MSAQNRRRSSADDDDDDDDDDMTCREKLEDFCDDKFWCKVKLFAIFIILLNMLFFAYKFYYLVTKPEVYRAKIIVAEKILCPYWFACCLICILFIQYGIFEENEWALSMFQTNTFLEFTFLGALLSSELVVVSKYGHFVPWNEFTVEMTAVKLFIVLFWGGLMLYLCLSYERGLKAKWEERDPTIGQMCFPWRCRSCRKS